MTWEKKTHANVNTVYNWDDAFAYVAELNAMNGGRGSPAITTGDCPMSGSSPARRLRPGPTLSIDPIFGPTAGGSNFAAYWSSTSWAAFYPEHNAWGVEFLDIYGTPASMIPFGKASALRVRAVRGGL